MEGLIPQGHEESPMEIYHAKKARYDYGEALKEYDSSFNTAGDQRIIDYFLGDISEIVMQNTKLFETHE